MHMKQCKRISVAALQTWWNESSDFLNYNFQLIPVDDDFFYTNGCPYTIRVKRDPFENVNIGISVRLVSFVRLQAISVLC